MAGQWRELAWRLLPGTMMAIVGGGLSQMGWLKPAEHLAYNYLFQLRGATAWDQRVVIVAIDDNSIQQLGRYPWSRQSFTQLMQRLNQATGSVVAFDVIFSEPSQADAAFEAAIAQHGQVVLASAIDTNGLPLLPIPPLREAAVGVGHIIRPIDDDGISRSVALSWRGEDSLSWAAVQAYGLTHSIPPNEPRPRDFWLNWSGAARQIPQYSFIDVLNRQVAPSQLQNKIIFVGITATGFDTLPTPFDRNPPVTGVYLHATAAHNLLQQNYLQPLERHWWEWAVLLVLPGFGLLLSVLRTEWQIATIGISVFGILGAGVVLLHGHYWLPIALPLSLVTGTGAMVALTERLRMNHFLHRQVRHLWQSYPATVINSSLPPAPSSWLHLPSSQPRSLLVLQELTAIAEHLGQTQANQAAIAHNLAVGVLSADQTGRIWFINPLASQWLQLGVGDNLVECVSQNWWTAEDWTQLMSALNLSALNPGNAPEAGWEREVLQGDRWFWLKLATINLASAELTKLPTHNLVLLLEDITARKQIEANLAKQNQELQWIGQLKDDFISTISHELRSPVTNMLLAIELLKISREASQQLKYIRQIESECLRERDFINDLLSFQQNTVWESPQHPQSIQLQTWLPDMISPFQSRAATRQQLIVTKIAPDLPTLQINVISLERMLRELLTNACKYTPSGQQIVVKAFTQGATHLLVSVQNFGVEIPPEEFSRIFDKFYRIPQADPWKQGGTGLGLAIVKRLIEQMGGTIALQSQNGYTQFDLCIPIVDQR
jgi:CHASE2 domain-containing sensor protein/signal transduction histidine kinase